MAELDQPSNGKPSFWTTLPGVLTAITGFIGAVAALLVAIQQFSGGKQTPPPATNQPAGSESSSTTTTQPSSTATSCHVSGVVYDQDKLPSAVGLPDIQIAYATISKPGSPMQMTTTDPYGKFSFATPSINAADFPIHLQMTYSWGGQHQIVQWDDPVYAGDNTASLYLSIHAVTAVRHVSPEIMHVNLNSLTTAQRSNLRLTNAISRIRLQ
jgi:hypothetical protein